MDQKSETNSINFETFVLSLATATFVALGEIENPVSKKKESNLEAAKQNIDILELLVQKTKSNLSEREDKLIQDVLYETRLRYVEKQKQ
ncbi:MAG: hypothetical protein COV44_08270 [Deltaproteobacteria bacterium CG11_big_fil_rev_8_21_14_0_20_45_16]|nr:MAG: hypothetical protein COV44_08270 [Deltaproteobacteria bacterium CG11_big_fil_rev_8_21_14_0_20_45_16]